jgi:pilus assembly protein Flp/PilA
MLKLIRKFVKNESGATAIENGLIAALVAVDAITALTSMGTELSEMFDLVGTELNNAQ